MKYEQRDIFIVKDANSGTIHKIFGIEAEAEAYLKRLIAHNNVEIDNVLVIDQWPVEFEVKP